MSKMPSLLVAIASYGTAQDEYLERLLEEFRNMQWQKRVIILTNKSKPVNGAELLVGLPSSNPYSLPFAHRNLFAENLNNYDLFLYTEDDILFTQRNAEDFLSLQAKLKDDEILGFIRSETSLDGNKFITSIHHHFRWLPESVVERGGELFAELTNQHSGCFIATRPQLERAIKSGGFLVKPYAGTYGMLESAASDIYTRCALKRLICVSRIKDFILPHLPNKYYKRLGIPIEELEHQVASLVDVHRHNRWCGSLFNPQTDLPGFRGSKTLFERPDEDFLGLVPQSTRRLLSVGCGWGESETWLRNKGIHVTAIPIDTIFADDLRRRQIETLEGTFETVVERLGDRQFDVILLTDMMQLVENPLKWLQILKKHIVRGGRLVARIENVSEPLSWVKDKREGHRRPIYPEFGRYKAHSVGYSQMQDWFRAAGLTVVNCTNVLEGPRRWVKNLRLNVLEPLFASRYIVVAERRYRDTVTAAGSS